MLSYCRKQSISVEILFMPSNTCYSFKRPQYLHKDRVILRMGGWGKSNAEQNQYQIKGANFVL